MDVKERFKLNKLRVIRTIGKGTYGNVYLCEKRDKRRSFTIVKDIELNVKIQNHNQEIANEVKILSTMNHPNIIKFFDCYYQEKYIMICMEYATRGNLAEYMYERCPKLIKQAAAYIKAVTFGTIKAYAPRIEEFIDFIKIVDIAYLTDFNVIYAEIIFYFSQILLGVHYIHKLNIIHRDLKAENILLTGKHGTLIKIGDFGISKMLASAKKTSTVIGTPYYLAPELCEGKPYDTKSDVWALGCLLYEMCTHKRAFDSETLVGLVKVITSGSVHPIDMTVYDRGLQDLIDLMLSIVPEKRPTIKELMGRAILLPIVYSVYLDAGNDELLYLKATKEYGFM